MTLKLSGNGAYVYKRECTERGSDNSTILQNTRLNYDLAAVGQTGYVNSVIPLLFWKLVAPMEGS